MNDQGESFNYWIWFRNFRRKFSYILTVWIFPIGSVLLLTYIIFIPKIVKPNSAWILTTDKLLGIITLLLTLIGSKIIDTIKKEVTELPIRTVLRDNARNHFLKHVESNDEVNIIIYTSYTIFSKWDELRLKYPEVEKAKIRMLLKDPDVEGQLRPEYVDMRWDQLNLALNKIEGYMKSVDIEIRYYKNEPWIRGIEVGKKYLWLSHYTNRKEAMPDTQDVEYSSVDTPWIFIDKTKSLKGIDTRNIDRFHSFFEMVWGNCTKYKNLIIDLDGTLFFKEEFNNFFNEEIPRRFIKEYAEGKDVENEFQTLKNEINRTGVSFTETLVKYAKDNYDDSFELNEYINWKDNQCSDLDETIYPEVNDVLKKHLSDASRTYRLVLLTNHTSKIANIVLRKMQLSELFGKNIVTIDDTKLVKPAEGILFYLMDDLGLDLKLSVFIGDRQHVDLFDSFKSSLARVYVKSPKELIQFLEDLKFPIKYLTRYPSQNRGYTIQVP